MEARKVVPDVQGINGGLTSKGTLRLTDYHLVFSAPPPPGVGSSTAVRESWIPYPLLASCVVRPVLPSLGIPSSIRIRCRDFTFVTFNFADDKIAKEVFNFMKTRACKLGKLENLYAFKHVPLKTEKAVNGWELYDARAEFRRQGISEKLPDQGWRITEINKNYTLCDTYPATLAVPSTISDNVLKYAKDFRSRARIPALTYLHPVNGCSITRCSQPMTGVSRKHNVQDEKLVAASFSACIPSGSEESTPATSQRDLNAGDIHEAYAEVVDMQGQDANTAALMYDPKTGNRLLYGAQQKNLIVDARPLRNALANHLTGLGSEFMERYKFASKVYLDIENIHVMRRSLDAVIEAIKDADVSPLPPNRQALNASDWLHHVKMVLTGAGLIARQVGINHSHVLIHCSDGWDRTSQLSALSQMMLDPYFRTIDGFIVLVEKDWLSFGHMFRLRTGPLSSETWFSMQRDGMAGSTVQPGDNDGRSDALQNVFAGARRLFNQVKDDPDVDAANDSAAKGADSENTEVKMHSPTFHQFLDCVYQMVRQQPNRFEFNERFLRRLLYHLYSCQYGTFLYNSEKQRHDAKISQRTSSVWDYFLARRKEFTNPTYNPAIDDHVKGQERMVFPVLKDIRWWHQVFNRTDEEMNSHLNAAATSAAEQAEAAATLGLPQARNPNEGPSAFPDPVQSDSASASSLPLPQQPVSLQRSASAESAGAFASIRDGISSLSLLGRGSSSRDEPAAPIRTDEELREMT